MDKEEKSHDRCSLKRNAEKCMRDAAMMFEACYRPAEAPECVYVWQFSRNCHSHRGIGRSPVQTSARETRAR